MNLLIDTHALIWFLNGEKRLSKKAILAIENPDNTCFISIASIWEIGIKYRLNKITLPNGLESFLNLIIQNGFEVLPITFKDILVLSDLEFIHKDPFDRLIISQTISGDFSLITIDVNISKYELSILW